MKSRILVVDDHPDILRLLICLLETAGYAVITATRGDDALEQWQAHQPDLVLLDINLPGMTGDTVCHVIKTSSSTPVIIMTGQAVTEIQLSQRVPGADGYLLKPFDVMGLVEQIAQLLDGVVLKSVEAGR
jgi:CheY-like chemotaxis protein